MKVQGNSMSDGNTRSIVQVKPYVTVEWPVAYAEKNFKGASMILRPPNGNGQTWLKANITIPKVRSVRVAPGYMVILYEKSDASGVILSGDTCHLASDTPTLPKLDEKVSAIYVERFTGPIVFSERYFQGAAQSLAKPGIYNWCFGGLPIGNNTIRSVWMLPGFKLTLHEHCDGDVQYGDTLEVTKSLSVLPKLDRDSSAVTVELVGPIVYSNQHYWGKAHPLLKPGVYGAFELNVQKIWSVRIPPGYKITLHESGTQGKPEGKTVVLAGETPIIPKIASAAVITVERNTGPVLFSEPNYQGEAFFLNVGTIQEVAIPIQSVYVPGGYKVKIEEEEEEGADKAKKEKEEDEDESDESDKEKEAKRAQKAHHVITISVPTFKLKRKLVSVTVEGTALKLLTGRWGDVMLIENGDGGVSGQWLDRQRRPPFSGTRFAEILVLRFPDDKTYTAKLNKDANVISWSCGSVWVRGDAPIKNQYNAPSKSRCQPQPPCSPGYKFTPGKIPGQGKVDGLGGYQSVTSCQQCADHCTASKNCKSYECSMGELKCNLNKESKPTEPPFMDFMFCSKQ